MAGSRFTRSGNEDVLSFLLITWVVEDAELPTDDQGTGKYMFQEIFCFLEEAGEHFLERSFESTRIVNA